MGMIISENPISIQRIERSFTGDHPNPVAPKTVLLLGNPKEPKCKSSTAATS